MTLRPSPRLRIDATYLYDRLGTGTNSEPGLPARTPIFNNHLARSKLNYQFTRELSLRLILDYFALLPNTSLSSLEPFKGFTSDLLLEYRLNPWTAVFAGYTDQREHFAMNPLSSTPGAFHGRLIRPCRPAVLHQAELFAVSIARIPARSFKNGRDRKSRRIAYREWPCACLLARGMGLEANYQLHHSNQSHRPACPTAGADRRESDRRLLSGSPHRTPVCGTLAASTRAKVDVPAQDRRRQEKMSYQRDGSRCRSFTRITTSIPKKSPSRTSIF